MSKDNEEHLGGIPMSECVETLTKDHALWPDAIPYKSYEDLARRRYCLYKTLREIEIHKAAERESNT